MSAQILSAVAGQQQKPRGIARKAAPPHISLCDKYLNPDYQGNETHTSLEWNSDENGDATPAYAKLVFGYSEEPVISSDVPNTADNNGVFRIEIAPNSPFSQTVHWPPFGYESFSDPSSPFNVLPYPGKSLVVNDLVSKGDHPESFRDSAMVALLPGPLSQNQTLTSYHFLGLFHNRRQSIDIGADELTLEELIGNYERH